jgi:hypothetical protein
MVLSSLSCGRCFCQPATFEGTPIIWPFSPAEVSLVVRLSSSDLPNAVGRGGCGGRLRLKQSHPISKQTITPPMNAPTMPPARLPEEMSWELVLVGDEVLDVGDADIVVAVLVRVPWVAAGLALVPVDIASDVAVFAGTLALAAGLT